MNKVVLSLVIFSAILAGASAAGYDEKMAKELAHVSYASYCDADTHKAFSCGNNCKFLTGFKPFAFKEYLLSYKHSISYSTYTHPDTKRFIVAFRGTSNVIQLASEFKNSGPLDCTLCKTPGAKVSEYFLNYYDSVFKAEFVEAMKAAAKAHAGWDFYITGHSLGGAFATIAALHLSVEGIFPKERMYLYTFGSPRVGNRIFAKAVENNVKNAFRVVHNKDVVPHVPPCHSHNNKCIPEQQDQEDGHVHNTFYGWHISPEVLYNEDFTSYRICKDEEDATCSNSFSTMSLSVLEHKLYLGARNECKKKLFNLRLPSFKEMKEFFDDDDISKDDVKSFLKGIMG